MNGEFRPVLVCLLVCGCLLAASCGNVGEPLYPSLKVPVRITDLRAVERANAIVIDFTVPAITTDGLAIKTVRSVELRCGDRTVPVNATEPGPVHADVPVDGLAGSDVVVHARVVGSKGHASEWSNAVTLHILPPLAAPRDVRAEGVPEGVRVTWSGAAEPHFRVFRLIGDESKPSQIGESDGPAFVDTKTEYGKTYRYSVQAVNGSAESDLSPSSAPLTTKDVFPPAVPSGLTAAPGINSVELAWDRNTEPDFKCYRVYRSVGDGPFELIAGNIEAPSYSDKTVSAGVRYRYTVAAVDQSGNPSKQSPAVEITP
jgi:fibronectin type 3 domain-containing protein